MLRRAVRRGREWLYTADWFAIVLAALFATMCWNLYHTTESDAQLFDTRQRLSSVERDLHEFLESRQVAVSESRNIQCQILWDVGGTSPLCDGVQSPEPPAAPMTDAPP